MILFSMLNCFHLSLINQPYYLYCKMQKFYNIFKDDPVVLSGARMKEFRTEYIIISTYILLRHLLKYYVFAEKEEKIIRNITRATTIEK